MRLEGKCWSRYQEAACVEVCKRLTFLLLFQSRKEDMTPARLLDIRDGVLIPVSHMNEAERWNHILSLDEELLKGGVILSEWCSFIVRESDLAFVHGAKLASILTAVFGIVTYLRSEYAKKERGTLLNLSMMLP